MVSFRQKVVIGGTREEKEDQKNCSCKFSHSFILLDDFSDNIHATNIL